MILNRLGKTFHVWFDTASVDLESKQRCSKTEREHRYGFCRYVAMTVLVLVLGTQGCKLRPGQASVAAQGAAPRSAVQQISENFYAERVQPILTKRCAVCHSCNDSPCQLDLTAYDGVDRGANQMEVYANRVFNAPPTRLFIDAQTTEKWRRFGFFPVVQHYPAGDPRNVDESTLYQLIAYRRNNALPQMHFDSSSSRSCPNFGTSTTWLETHLAATMKIDLFPYLGMPFGLPALTEEEVSTIRTWLLNGSTRPKQSSIIDSAQQTEIEKWERFFNAPTPKRQLISRYLYEHLFYAHLFFGTTQAGKRPAFFRLVRSRTIAPLPIDEIASRLLYEDPGSTFYYRIRPVESVITHKTHLPYELSDSRMARIKELFDGNDWDVRSDELPDYDQQRSANPFETFAKIPPSARYQFMLDEAEYFVASFLKGPVCRGSMALNVINEHFLIFFLDPKADQSVQDPEFFKTTAGSLNTPFQPGDLLSADNPLWSVWELPRRALNQLRQTYYPNYKERQLEYLQQENAFYAKAFPNGFSLEDIWGGDGWNPNAVITVFRHVDNASVTRGAFGGRPKTSLVLDYPIFERMYYNLVASFDVFSGIEKQLATRLYMDDLRIEGEDLFLSFLPLKQRIPLRNFWYRKAESKINSKSYPFYGTSIGKPRGTQIAFPVGGNAKDDFISMVLNDRFAAPVRGPGDELNSGKEVNYDFAPIANVEDLNRDLTGLGGHSGPFVPLLPELSFVRFHLANGGTNDELPYTFIRNTAHFNVKYLFFESSRLNPAEDTLTIIPGFIGSRPNFFFDVPASETEHFLADLVTLKKGNGSIKRFIAQFGVRRTDAKFWEVSDWFNSRFAETDPIGSGIFDLNYYKSR